MRKKRVLFFNEPQVHTILLRRLSRHGYRIYPKARLADAIGPEPGSQRLPARAFEYLLKAHIDFLVVRDDMPILAVEFDGLRHLTDPDALERDIKEIAEDLRQYAEGLPEDTDPNDAAVDLDPTVHFDLRHPFPGTAIAEDRLWRRHRIASINDYEKRNQDPRAVCAVELKRCGVLKHDEFHTCEATASVWSPTALRDEAVFRHDVSVTLRSFMRLRPNPKTDEGALFGLEALEPLMDRVPGLLVEEVWFPDVPGVNAWDVARHFVDYLGLTAIERWAETGRPTNA